MYIIFAKYYMKILHSAYTIQYFHITFSVMLHLPVTIAYALLEYTQDDGFFKLAESIKDTQKVEFSWSFYVNIVGAVLNPIGIFIICTHWHQQEDKEGTWNKDTNWHGGSHHDAGREFNVYNGKDKPNTEAGLF